MEDIGLEDAISLSAMESRLGLNDGFTVPMTAAQEIASNKPHSVILDTEGSSAVHSSSFDHGSSSSYNAFLKKRAIIELEVKPTTPTVRAPKRSCYKKK